jgi:hypothetical protein
VSGILAPIRLSYLDFAERNWCKLSLITYCGVKLSVYVFSISQGDNHDDKLLVMDFVDHAGSHRRGFAMLPARKASCNPKAEDHRQGHGLSRLYVLVLVGQSWQVVSERSAGFQLRISFALSSLNLADGLLKRDGILRIGFGGVKSPYIIKIFEILQDTVPLCERQQNGFTALLLVHNVFGM